MILSELCPYCGATADTVHVDRVVYNCGNIVQTTGVPSRRSGECLVAELRMLTNANHQLRLDIKDALDEIDEQVSIVVALGGQVDVLSARLEKMKREADNG